MKFSQTADSLWHVSEEGQELDEIWQEIKDTDYVAGAREAEYFAEIRPLVHSSVEDKDEMAQYIAQTFGDKWQEAISLLGHQLFNPARRKFIALAKAASVPLAEMADLIGYREYTQDMSDSVVVESFPKAFIDLIFKHVRSKPKVMQLYITALWTIYRAVRRGWSSGLTSTEAQLLGRIKCPQFDKAMRTFIKEQKSRLKNATDDY